jgi:hypothetical protein
VLSSFGVSDGSTVTVAGLVPGVLVNRDDDEFEGEPFDYRTNRGWAGSTVGAHSVTQDQYMRMVMIGDQASGPGSAPNTCISFASKKD